MAEIFVATGGNDTTGNGSSGTPYASLKKALSVAAAGDVIRMGAGTYAEDSGSGYLSLHNITFASYIHVVPDNGTIGSVVITGTSAIQAVIFGATTFIRFHGVTFRSQADTVTQLVRFNSSGTLSDIIFDTCTFEILGKSGVTNVGLASSWASVTSTLSRVRFLNCKRKQIGPYPVAGILLDRQFASIAVSDWEFINPEIIVGSFAARLMGMSRFLIVNPTFTSSNPTVASTALQIGQDSYTGVDTTGFISGGTVSSLIGHAAVIGGGCSDVEVVGTTFTGGYNSSNGQGLVLKNITGGAVRRVTVHGGYLSTLYLKACQNMLIEDSVFYNRFATAAAIKGAINNEDNSKVANNTIRQCVAYAHVGSLIDWANASGDAGGNVIDQNVYAVAGSGIWGTVRGSTIASLSALKGAWVGYDRPGNDNNSRAGLRSLRHRGDRELALA